MLKLNPNILSNNFSRIPQSGEPSFYPKRTPEDGLIDWDKPLKEIHNFVKALTKPYPGAFSFIDKQKIMIWEAQPFDTKITFPNSHYGEVVEKFSSGDFVINCMDGSLLITNYEGDVESGDTFSNLYPGLK